MAVHKQSTLRFLNSASVAWSGFDSVYYWLSIEDCSKEGDFYTFCEDVAAIEPDEHLTVFHGNDEAFVLVRSPRSFAGYKTCLMTADEWRVFLPSVNSLHSGIYIQLPPKYLAAVAPRDVDEQVRFLVESIFRLKVAKSRISRADFTFDIACAYFQDLPVPNMNLGDPLTEIVTRCVDRQPYFSPRYTGLSVGRNDIVFRLYDKKYQVKKQKLDKDFYQKLWNFTDEQYENTDIVRIEFAMRGDALRRFMIHTEESSYWCEFENLQMLVNHKADILAYLFGWLRFCKPSKRKSKDRPLLDWWAKIVSLCKGSFSEPRRYLLKRCYDPKSLRSQDLRLQYLGLLRAIVGREMIRDDIDFKDVTPSQWHHLSALILDDIFDNDIERHDKKFEDMFFRLVAASVRAASSVAE